MPHGRFRIVLSVVGCFLACVDAASEATAQATSQPSESAVSGSSTVDALPAGITPAPAGSTLPRAEPRRFASAATPASPWKPLFFDNDFSSYVGKEPYVLGEELKDLSLGTAGDGLDLSFSTGGQIRHRYMSESDRIRPGGPGESTYHLWRWRHYFDLDSEYFRIYVETIAADSFGEELAPLPIDVNRFDLLNAFIDLKLYADDDLGAGTFRYGRQELLYGKQRLLSPLDWSNTRRSFHGAKFFHVADGWRFDAFAVNPVNAAARGVDFTQYDSSPDEADHRRTLFGGYLTMTANPSLSADVYMLYQDDERPRPNFAEGDRGLNGMRLYGVLPSVGGRTWDYDLEGGYQWGSDRGRRVSAGFATAELGHTWKNAAWKPRISGLVYYGSGSPTDNETFYTYYPLGHAYWGIIDHLAGQNLVDLSPQFSVAPTNRLELSGAYHYFSKADDSGFLYNVAQAPVGPVRSGHHIGQEIDLVATWTYNPNLSVQAGYAHFWYGEAGRAVTRRDAADFFYLQTTFNY